MENEVQQHATSPWVRKNREYEEEVINALEKAVELEPIPQTLNFWSIRQRRTQTDWLKNYVRKLQNANSDSTVEENRRTAYASSVKYINKISYVDSCHGEKNW